MPAKPRGDNNLIVNGDITEVILCNRSNIEIARTIINTKNIPKITGIRWSLDNTATGYARSGPKHVNIRLHRLITDAPKDMMVDHINHNTLDNREENLRVCTRSQNGMNRKTNSNTTSGHRGVYWNEDTDKWAAQISVNNAMTYLGLYDTKGEAIVVRNNAEIREFGDFRNKQEGYNV